MTRPHLIHTEAIVIKRVDLGEADKIVTLYTPNVGKLRAVAKGVRRPSSRLGGHVEMFTYSDMLLARGRNLDIVTQSQTLDAFIGMRDDLWRTSCASYVGEIVDQFTEENLENYPVFELLKRTFERLANWRQPDMAVRLFEMQLLDHLGYRPELRRCLKCNQDVAATPNYFSASSGGILCLECGRGSASAQPVSINTQKALRLLQVNDAETASRLRLDEAVQSEVEGTLRTYIRYILEREPKSLGVLKAIRR